MTAKGRSVFQKEKTVVYDNKGELLFTEVSPLDKNIERKQLFVLFQCQGTLECGSYQGHLTCLSSHPWREIQGRYTQLEAGG